MRLTQLVDGAEVWQEHKVLSLQQGRGQRPAHQLLQSRQGGARAHDAEDTALVMALAKAHKTGP